MWEKISRAGFVEKYGARFLLGSGDTEKKVVFAAGLVPGLGQTYQVERARFDALLLDHARELGAEIAQPATVRALAEDADGLSVEIESAGSTRQVRARHVIDASGRDQFFPCELKTALEPAAFPRRIAIYNHFRGVPREDGPAGGDTIVARLPEGWFWIIPLSDGLTSVGLVTTQAAFKTAGLAPADHFAHVVQNTPRLRALLAGAVPTLGFHVTADYSYYRRDLAEGRMILVGDAGGFLDPIFSSGVYLALYSAKHAAELVVRAHRENRPFTAAECRRYATGLKSHAGVFRRLIEAFYDDHSFGVFMCPRPPLDLGRGITSIVAGHARLTWPLWWRFNVFLLVCRLQRRFPFVTRIDLADTPSREIAAPSPLSP